MAGLFGRTSLRSVIGMRHKPIDRNSTPSFLAVAVFLVCAALYPASGVALAASSWEALLEQKSGDDFIPILVRFRNPTDSTTIYQNDRRIRRSALIQRLKFRARSSEERWRARLPDGRARRMRSLWMINGVAIEAPVALVRELLDDPDVESVRLDKVVSLAPSPNDLANPEPAGWNVRMVRAPEMWASIGHRGRQAVVATLDSGVDLNHSDLKSRWRGGLNSWFDPHGEHLLPYDRSGHGTQTMGVIVGGSSSGEVVGIAPDARWIAAKIFNDRGLSTFSIIHEAFQWILDPDGDPSTDDAPSVVVCSWGIDGTLDRCSLEFSADIEALRAAGIAVVFSAGNDGPGAWTSSSPANMPGSLAVGAVDASMRIAPFSSRGPSACSGEVYPQLVAPGVAVRTTDLTAGGVFPNATTTVSGTSFSAPHVGGALALLASAWTEEPLHRLEAALLRTAMDLGAPGPDSNYGCGLVDVVAAHYDLLAGLPCTDSDGDGYFAEPGCGTPRDCQDSSAAIHPGALEIPFDGIDQDCNGFDLTIRVRRALCNSRRKTLRILATSELGQNANLIVNGFGAMSHARGRSWSATFGNVEVCPAAITVTGREGTLSVGVLTIPRR